MKNLIKVFVVIFLFTVSLQAQFTYVEPGDSTLRLAIENANDLDVLILQNGGLYTDSGDSTIVISKNITIAAENRNGAYPVITNTKYKTGVDSVRSNLFTLVSGGQLYLQYLELNGLMSDTTQFRALENFVKIDGTEMTILLSLEFEECFIHGAEGYIVDGTGDGVFPGPTLLNLTVGDCLMTNTKGFYFTEVSMTSFGIGHSTAWDIEGPIVDFGNDLTDLSMNADPGVVSFNYCTFDDFGEGFARTTNASGMWNIYNCIFTNNKNTAVELFTGVGSITGEITNNNFYNTGSLGLNEALMADNYQVNPEYADAANGDFTLPAASILQAGAATNGGVGDPRWHTDITSIDEINSVPESFVLQQNYPNPFNPETKIKYSIKDDIRVNLSVYNLSGELVRTLVDADQQAGTYTLNFSGNSLSSGVYLYRLTAGEFRESKKMILIK